MGKVVPPWGQPTIVASPGGGLYHLPSHVLYKYNTTQTLKHETFDRGQSVFRSWYDGVSRALEFLDDIYDLLGLFSSGFFKRKHIFVLFRRTLSPSCEVICNMANEAISSSGEAFDLLGGTFRQDF